MQLNGAPDQQRPIVQFKQELEDAIEAQLRANGLTVEQSEIADLTFGFNNSNILNLLTMRAAALKANKFDVAKEFDRKITEEKNKNFDKIVRPNSFFCTFRHETGQHKAIEMKDQLTFKGEKIEKLKRACEPTDLIWENKEVTPA